VVLPDGLRLRDGQILLPRRAQIAQLEEQDVGAQVAQLGGVLRVGELLQVKAVRLGGLPVAILVDDLRLLLVLLRLRVQLLRARPASGDPGSPSPTRCSGRS
jgi:hypothetical protein